jgi:hypothetical protein
MLCFGNCSCNVPTWFSQSNEMFWELLRTQIWLCSVNILATSEEYFVYPNTNTFFNHQHNWTHCVIRTFGGNVFTPFPQLKGNVLWTFTEPVFVCWVGFLNPLYSSQNENTVRVHFLRNVSPEHAELMWWVSNPVIVIIFLGPQHATQQCYRGTIYKCVGWGPAAILFHDLNKSTTTSLNTSI